MRHFTSEEWLLYVQNQLQQEKQSELEDHLYCCDQCLSLYLDVLNQYESELPILNDEASFTDNVMMQLSDSNGEHTEIPKMGTVNVVKQKNIKKKPFYQTAVFHYMLAAAMTFILMTTGVFQSLANYMDTVPNKQQIYEQNPTVTEGIINKTFAWMDTIQHSNKEGDK